MTPPATTPEQPSTAAGRELLFNALLPENIDSFVTLPGYIHLDELRDAILAIEAEARDALLAALRALGNDLTPGGWHAISCDLAEPHWPACEQARALLRDLSPKEEGQ